jgi:hypothetical protein
MGRYKSGENEKEDVSSYWMILRNKRDTGKHTRSHSVENLL